MPCWARGVVFPLTLPDPLPVSPGRSPSRWRSAFGEGVGWCLTLTSGPDPYFPLVTPPKGGGAVKHLMFRLALAAGLVLAAAQAALANMPKRY